MLVVLSADMEGVSQLVGPNEIIACCDEYWATGKPRFEADVAAACRGLLAGGVDEVIVLDNHASGNTYNIPQDALPAGARLEEWHVFDLPGRGVGAMLQVGYHARGGVEGFLSHTYSPGLRLRVGDELISESHARAWAAGVPLLGIVGNDVHARTLGSLDGTPYLVVQETRSRSEAAPVFGETEGLDAIEAFAEQCILERDGATVPIPPAGVTFAASMPNGAEVREEMEAAGWSRTGDVEYAVELESWQDARAPLAAAMNAAIAPFAPVWLTGLSTAEASAHADREKARQLASAIGSWASASAPEWFTEPAASF